MRKLIIPIVAMSSVALSVVGVTGTRPAHADDVQQVRVDLGDRTGEFFGASSGVLYGLSDEGVPSDNTLEPLRMHSINQKPPAGAQHPNGDAMVVAEPTGSSTTSGTSWAPVTRRHTGPGWPPI